MPSNWDGVLILLAVTAITLGAEAIRRILPPPRYRGPIPDPYPIPDLTIPHDEPNPAPAASKKTQTGEEEISI